MAEEPLYTFYIDMKDVDVALGRKLTPSNQIDFSFKLISFLNSTSLSQCNKIRIILLLKTTSIDVSPVLLVPSSVFEFSELIYECLINGFVKSGSIKILNQRKTLPEITSSCYLPFSMANDVLNPDEIINSSQSFYLTNNKDPEINVKKICFSKYPLSPINQVANIIYSVETFKNLQ